MLRHPYRKNDEENGGGGTGAPIQKGFDALSDTGFVETAVPADDNKGGDDPENKGAGGDDPSKVQAAADDNKGAGGDDNKGAAAAADEVEPVFDDKGNQVDDKGEIIKTKQEIDDEAGIITEFKIEGDDSNKGADENDPDRKKAIEELEKEQSWKNLAKVQGVDIKEDTFEAYDTALKAKAETDKVQILAEAKVQAKQEMLAEKPVEVMAIIEGLEQGIPLEDIIAPTRQIERLEALTNSELIAEDCRLKGWSEDLIEKHIEDLTTNDKLDITAQPLRDILKTNKEGLAAEHLQRFTSLKQSKIAAAEEARTKESGEIKDTLIGMKEFMGVPITDKTVGHIVQKWNKGEYHEAFKDSKVVSEFLMYKEFGQQGLKALANREYQRGRDEKAKKLHNIPPVVKDAAGKVKPANVVKPEGNFGALPD